MKIAIIVGTRPEAIKQIPVYFAAKKAGIDCSLISTGQHKEMLQQVFDWFEVRPDVDLQIMQPDQTLASLTAQVLIRLDLLFKETQPDLVVVQGDTTTAFTASLAAFYNKIHVAHVEAGLRTYNKLSPWPEEINRSLISKLADFHFAPTSWSAQNLLQEHIEPASIFITGNTVIDALLFTKNKTKQLNIYPPALKDYFEGSRADEKIVLITGHRRENWGQGFAAICNAIHTLAKWHPDFSFIYPVHLNPNVREVVYRTLNDTPNVLLIDPLSYPEFVRLMERSFLILTDSGGVQEEAPSLAKPVLLMRDTTERPEGVEAGSVKLVGTSEQAITDAFEELAGNPEIYHQMSHVQNPYGDGTASNKIIEILQASFKK